MCGRNATDLESQLLSLTHVWRWLCQLELLRDLKLLLRTIHVLLAGGFSQIGVLLLMLMMLRMLMMLMILSMLMMLILIIMLSSSLTHGFLLEGYLQEIPIPASAIHHGILVLC